MSELAAALAALIVLAGGALSVAMAIASRRKRRPGVDPFALGEPWRRFVQQAMQAQARFRHTVAVTKPGPLQERLTEIGARVDAAVDECWEVAQRGHLVDRAVRSLGLDRVRARLDHADPDPAAVQALRAQLESAERMSAVATDARERLRVLDARLGEAVARAAELSMRAVDLQQLGPVGADVDNVITDMEALRQALDEVGEVGGQPGSRA